MQPRVTFYTLCISRKLTKEALSTGTDILEKQSKMDYNEVEYMYTWAFLLIILTLGNSTAPPYVMSLQDNRRPQHSLRLSHC